MRALYDGAEPQESLQRESARLDCFRPITSAITGRKVLTVLFVAICLTAFQDGASAAQAGIASDGYAAALLFGGLAASTWPWRHGSRPRVAKSQSVPVQAWIPLSSDAVLGEMMHVAADAALGVDAEGTYDYAVVRTIVEAVNEAAEHADYNEVNALRASTSCRMLTEMVAPHLHGSHVAHLLLRTQFVTQVERRLFLERDDVVHRDVLAALSNLSQAASMIFRVPLGATLIVVLSAYQALRAAEQSAPQGLG